MWNQKGQECHEFSGCVQMFGCSNPMQRCDAGEKDWRGEDAGGSDPELMDLEEVYCMMECARWSTRGGGCGGGRGGVGCGSGLNWGPGP